MQKYINNFEIQDYMSLIAIIISVISIIWQMITYRNEKMEKIKVNVAITNMYGITPFGTGQYLGKNLDFTIYNLSPFPIYIHHIGIYRLLFKKKTIRLYSENLSFPIIVESRSNTNISLPYDEYFLINFKKQKGDRIRFALITGTDKHIKSNSLKLI